MAPSIDRREFLIASGAMTALTALRPESVHATGDRIRVVGLQVDNLDRPLGLENPQPLFSWRIESGDRNVRQSAYRIRVASSEQTLKEGRGDLWDSEKVPSSQSNGIRYAGRALASRQRCWWCVEAWDESAQSSSISDLSGWEMGLLSPGDWQARWLAVERAVDRADREAGLHWIWGSPSPDEISRKFRLKVNLPHPATGGVLIVGGKDHLAGVWIDNQSVPIEPRPQYSIGEPLITLPLQRLAPGAHTIAVEMQMRTDEMRSPAGAMTAFIRMEFEDGSLLRISREAQWRTSLTQDSDWFKTGYEDRQWEQARALPTETSQPWPPAPAMHLRKEFPVQKTVSHARLYATALGAYEARLNGKRVGDALLTPESTLYSKRVLYRVYDVTDQVHVGVNALGLTVGDGWYASTMFAAGRYAWGPPPRRALAQLELTFTDGSRQTVVTGPDWRIAQSPIVCSEIYNGEQVDTRLAKVGWDTPGFNDCEWPHSEVGETPPCELMAQISAPIRATQELLPHAVTHPTPGIYVIDFGQNFAGWCRLRVAGAAGTRIEMRFAERVLPNGEVDQSNLRGAKQTDVVILRGEGTEEFEPKFTYHGFRYVQIAGLATAPTAESIRGIVIHSDLKMTGQLRIGQPLIQQIWRNTVWTQRSNFTGIPTDCPQRDERFGYMADASIFWDAASFNMDTAAFSRRQLDNVSDNQDLSGAYAVAAPWPFPQPDPTPVFSDGGVILPWTVWQHYGDVSLIEGNWEGMNRQVQEILRHNPDYVWRNHRADIGDWLSVDAQYMTDFTTPNDLLGTAYWAHSVELLTQMSEAVGRKNETVSLKELHGRIRRAFIESFVKADGRVGNESQTSYVLALKFDLLPEELRAKAAANLVADIRRRGGALSTGIAGTRFILDVLADAGYGSVAYDLLLRTEYPSWGYMIAHGATTMWESWNGRVWSGPMGETMPDSQNHYFLGSLCNFLFRRVAGIDACGPGFKSIIVRPLTDPRIKTAGADYDSVMGRISSDWAQSADGSFSLDLTIPANASARIHLPASSNASIRESRRDVLHRDDLRLVSRSSREAIIEVGSGRYQFLVS